MRVPFRSSIAGSIPALLALWACATPGPAMTQQRMEELIAASAQELRGRPGAIEFRFDGVPMACISDTAHDRMRLIAPIAPAAELSAETLQRVLQANFHTSLDARYAVSEGILYSAYLHPLSRLSEDQLASALRQVATLARTFGSTYSSGELSFGSPGGREL